MAATPQSFGALQYDFGRIGLGVSLRRQLQCGLGLSGGLMRWSMMACLIGDSVVGPRFSSPSACLSRTDWGSWVDAPCGAKAFVERQASVRCIHVFGPFAKHLMPASHDEVGRLAVTCSPDCYQSEVKSGPFMMCV